MESREEFRERVLNEVLPKIFRESGGHMLKVSSQPEYIIVSSRPFTCQDFSVNTKDVVEK